jgi:predicted metalloprotease
MKWKRTGGGGDVIDARGASRGAGMPGGRVALPGGLGLVGVLVFLAIQVLGGGGGSGTAFDVPGAFDTGARAPQAAPIPASQDPERDLKDFSVYVFRDVQNMWEETFRRQGKSYEPAQLVLYRSGVNTGCGSASSAVGPFYCPSDRRVYLDLSFEREMSDRLGAGGDFAWAYVIAHEVGHHVQRLTGTSEDVRGEQAADRGRANELSVRLELQADCYAGVWAHGAFAAGQLEKGDIEEALGAAQAVGDDRLQRSARGSVDPDTFTHGTSEQRMRWFRAGYDGGEPAACDTFSAADV